MTIRSIRIRRGGQSQLRRLEALEELLRPPEHPERARIERWNAIHAWARATGGRAQELSSQVFLACDDLLAFTARDDVAATYVRDSVLTFGEMRFNLNPEQQGEYDELERGFDAAWAELNMLWQAAGSPQDGQP